jgi:hypothetical protein
MYRTIDYNLAIRLVNGEPKCVGFYDETNNVLPFTPEKEEIAKGLGLVIQ